jgi:large subunit ribosomal protein L22
MFARVAPRKCRLVVDMIRGKKYHDAQAILHFTFNKSARLVEKVLLSAFNNALNKKMDEDTLFISRIWVDEAGMAGIQGKLKRIQSAPQGRAHPILKRASHIHIELEERA